MKNSEKKIVVYTAIFGENYGLLEQPYFENVTYICFTDQKLNSKTWDVIQVELNNLDQTRKNRSYKILPHKYFPDYKISIYIDSNFLIVGDISDLINNVFKSQNFMCFNHDNVEGDERDCIYDEYEHILKLGSRKGRYKDDPDVMKKLILRYKEEDFPKNYGLIVGGILIRRHNVQEVINLMNDWWEIISKESKRDQLSFNYLVWKNKFSFSYLPGNPYKGNPWFYFIGNNRKNYSKKLIEYKIKKLFNRV